MPELSVGLLVESLEVFSLIYLFICFCGSPVVNICIILLNTLIIAQEPSISTLQGSIC